MTVNLLDLDYYRRVNPDLANFNDEQATQHFFDFGLREGRDFSPIVDLDLYKAANRDLAAVGFTENRQFFDHLANFGVAEGRLFSHSFKADFYRASHADLIAVGLNNEQLFDHFWQFGIDEGRVASNTFDIGFYLDRHPDLIAAGLTNRQGLTHFSQFGINEGRITSTQFDVGTYLSLHPDLIAAGLSSSQAFNHYQVFGIHEHRIAAPILPVPGDPGNTISTSFDLGAIVLGNRRFTNTISNGDLSDLYQFTLLRPSAIRSTSQFQQVFRESIGLGLTELLGDLDGNGQLEFDERLTIGGPISGVLPPGTYGLRTRLTENLLFNLDYTGNLLVSPVAAIPPDGAGNSASAARNLGALTTVQTANDSLGLFDLTDIYRFTLDAPTNIEAIVDGSRNVIIEIAEDRNNDGEIEIFQPSEIQREVIATARSENGLGFFLDAGTYFLRLRRDLADVDYTLTLSPQASRFPRDRAGNVISMALDLGELNAARSLSETVSATDSIDFYQFDINTPTNVGLVLNSSGSPLFAIGRDLNNSLFLEGGEILQQHFFGSNIPQETSWSLYLTPGTYFVSVGGISSYNLSIAPTPPPGLPTDAVGNSPDTARNLDVLTGMETVSDSIGSADEIDYYRFVLDRPSTVDVSLEVAENRFRGSATLTVLSDFNNNGLPFEPGEQTRNIPFDFETLTAEASLLLEPGVYFARVINSGDNNVDYDLSLSTI